ncbi:MAG: hypothetical protein ACLUEQ_07725 [Cloacibacillus evryensis]
MGHGAEAKAPLAVIIDESNNILNKTDGSLSLAETSAACCSWTISRASSKARRRRQGIDVSFQTAECLS